MTTRKYGVQRRAEARIHTKKAIGALERAGRALYGTPFEDLICGALQAVDNLDLALRKNQPQEEVWTS